MVHDWHIQSNAAVETTDESVATEKGCAGNGVTAAGATSEHMSALAPAAAATATV
jgi:hypothetical protein